MTVLQMSFSNVYFQWFFWRMVRVYAFGLGNHGQLGQRDSANRYYMHSFNECLTNRGQSVLSGTSRLLSFRANKRITPFIERVSPSLQNSNISNSFLHI